MAINCPGTSGFAQWWVSKGLRDQSCPQAASIPVGSISSAPHECQAVLGSLNPVSAAYPDLFTMKLAI